MAGNSSGFKSLAKHLDMFGATVRLNYRGEESYKTGCGALMTVLINGFMLYYAVSCFVRVSNNSDPQLSSYEILDTREEMDPMNLGELGFDMIFGFADSLTLAPIPFEPRFGRFDLSQSRIDTKIGEMKRQTNKRPLEVYERDLGQEEDAEKWGIFHKL